jgi:prepilin-type N-terminal cleavage/methylation domain-containing protein
MKQGTRGFSLIELLIVVAIILIIAAIAIPSLLQARIAANESSAVASLRTINTAMITYNSTYPSQGYAASLPVLGPDANPCTPSSTNACLIDSALAAGWKAGYNFAATGGAPQNGANTNYFASAVPVTLKVTGNRSFCAVDDAVVRVQPSGAGIASRAACTALTPVQ